DGGVVDHRVGQPDALAVAARQRADQAAPDLAEPAAVQAKVDAPGPVLAVDALELGPEIEVLVHAHLAVHRHALGQVADVLADLVGLRHHVVAGDLGDAAGGGQVAGEDAHGRGLAGAVGAEEADDLAAGDLEADTVDGQDRAEILERLWTLIMRTV